MPDNTFQSVADTNNADNKRLPALAADQQSLVERADTRQTIVICQGQQIPPGFVIIAQTTNFSCSNSLNNAWIIKRPGDTETVCGNSPIPPGYVITGRTTNFACSNQLNNALIIQRV